jgi:outer membrane lipoprotein-sorting protein
MIRAIPLPAALVAALALAHVVAGAPWDRPAGAQAPDETAAVGSIDDLLARLSRLQGLRARYEEEKSIALLKRPLRSRGSIAFAAPDLLLRRVEHPEPATLLLAGNTLRVADASGKRSIDLQGSPVVRHFVLTFVHVLRGDRAALERLYALRFSTEAGGGWLLELTPRNADLGKLIRRATVRGRASVVDEMTLEEGSGDTTRLRFSDVDVEARFDAAARARIFRLPGN